MHMAMKVVNGGQVVLQVLSVLVAIGALIAFIAASVKGTTNGVIAGGYIAVSDRAAVEHEIHMHRN